MGLGLRILERLRGRASGTVPDGRLPGLSAFDRNHSKSCVGTRTCEILSGAPKQMFYLRMGSVRSDELGDAPRRLASEDLEEQVRSAGHKLQNRVVDNRSVEARMADRDETISVAVQDQTTNAHSRSSRGRSVRCADGPDVVQQAGDTRRSLRCPAHEISEIGPDGRARGMCSLDVAELPAQVGRHARRTPNCGRTTTTLERHPARARHRGCRSPTCRGSRRGPARTPSSPRATQPGARAGPPGRPPDQP
jgi:hypothetical protein